MTNPDGERGFGAVMRNLICCVAIEKLIGRFKAIDDKQGIY